MIALSVARAADDVPVELLDEADLLVDEDVLERLLHDAAAVHLERQLEDVALEDLGHGRLLHLRALLEELLDDVCESGERRVSDSEADRRIVERYEMARTVGKDVGRELKHVGQDLGEDEALVVGRRSVELGLDVARAELVAAELDDVAHEVLQVGEPFEVSDFVSPRDWHDGQG